MPKYIPKIYVMHEHLLIYMEWHVWISKICSQISKEILSKKKIQSISVHWFYNCHYKFVLVVAIYWWNYHRPVKTKKMEFLKKLSHESVACFKILYSTWFEICQVIFSSIYIFSGECLIDRNFNMHLSSLLADYCIFARSSSL